MYLIRIILLLSLSLIFGFSKGEVSRIFAHKEGATATTYSLNGHTYKWGEGENLVIDGFEYDGHHYNYLSNSTIIKIRRVDNTQSSGTPCGLFAERKGGDAYKLEANYPQTNGNCDMAKVMGGRIINVGALDLFKNVSDSWDTAKNIERVDFISPKGIVAPAKSADLSRAGHVVTEKSGNNEIRIAPILSIDADNNPTLYGTLVRVMPHSSSSSFIRYKNCSIELPDGSSSYKRKLGFYRDNKKTSQGQQGKVWYLGNSYEPMGMAFVSLEELGISAGEKYYGFSYFGRDVTSAMDLTDISTFPHDTSGDTADPYGGVASYFVDRELGYGTCYGMIDDGTSLYEMDLSSESLFSEKKISTKFVGEGTAYRATNHKLYVFQTYKNGSIDKHGDSSSLYSIDLNSNITPIVPYKEQDNIVSDEVEGAEFYYNSATKKEILYIITSKKQVKNTYSLHAFYADNWTQELSGYPKVINNYRLDSLAIDPNTGQGYGIDDAGKTTAPKVYKLNLATGVATFLFQATDEYDAEGLAFAIDGKLYAEDEGGYSKLSRKIYRVDLEQKKFIEVRNLSGTKDIEGLSCNGVHSAPQFTISGYIFNDKNHNGKKDSGESGLEEESYLKLCRADNSFVKSIKADKVTGIYTLDNIDEGEYKIIEDASNSADCSTATDASGFISTTANSFNIDSSNIIDKNFGNYNGSTVSGYVYNDIDRDGHMDDGEVGIANVDLEMKRCGNIAFATATTDANGSYTFWVDKRDDYGDRWVGIWESDLADYNSTGDEFDNGDGNQIEKDGAEQDHSWLCFSNRVDVNFEKGGLTLVGNNFGDIKDNTIIANYHFDECSWSGTADEVKDSSGNGFHGKAMTSQTGNILPNTVGDEKIINRSAKFTKSKKQFVKITNFNNFDHTKFSASMWIRVDENVNGWQTLLHKGASNNATNGVFRIKYNYNYGHDKLGLYTTFDNGSSTSFYKTEVGLKDKQWHHLVVTYKDREYKIYLDKSLVASKEYSKDLKTPNSELHIGGKHYMSNMYIDEVKLYNDALDSSTIGTIFDNESIGKNWDGSSRDESVCGKPSIVIDGVEKLEGDSGATKFTVPIKLDKPAPKGGITLNYIPIGDAVDSSDFYDDEYGDYFSDKDDDNNKKIKISIHTIGNGYIDEGNSGTQKLKFEVRLDEYAPKGGINVQLGVEDITATEGEDYTKETSSLYFAEGVQKVYVEYIINGDTKEESDEAFTVSLHSPSSNAYIDEQQSSVVGMIMDDDSDNDDDDGDSWWSILFGGGNKDKNKISKSSKNSQNNKMGTRYQKNSKSEDGGSSGEDSEAESQNEETNSTKKLSITIPEGATEANITINIAGDEEVEEDESFILKFDEPENAILLNSTVIVVIGNDDSKLMADYRFDECIWDGTVGEIIDSSGNEHNATGKAYSKSEDIGLQNIADGKLERAGEFPNEKTPSSHSVVWTGVDVDDDIRGEGGISFWFKSKDNWSGGVGRTLIDATTKNDKYFYLALKSDGRLHFAFEDSEDNDFNATTRVLPFLKDEWVHVAISWNLTKENKIYINGSKEELNITTNTISKKSFGNLSSVNIGDYINNGESEDRENSANGFIDEVKIFKGYIKDSKISDIYNNELAGKNWDGTVRDTVICKAPMEPFVCSDTLYLSNRNQDGTSSSDDGKTWLHTINQTHNPYDYDSIGSGYSHKYNAIGYNIKDNFIYGLKENRLIKIDKNEVVEDLGEVTGLPTNQQLYAGEFGRDGYFYVSGDGGASDILYRIDIVNKIATKLNLRYSMKGKNEPVMFWDMAVDETGDYLYAMLVTDSGETFQNDKVVKIDITASASAGIMTPIGGSHDTLSSYISLVFSDIEGKVYMMANDNGYYKLDTDSGQLYRLVSTKELTYLNDGTACSDSNFTEPLLISIDDVSQREGDSGATTDFIFTVTFSKKPVSVGGIKFKYQLFDANHSDDRFNAHNPEDYIADKSPTKVELNGSDLTYNIIVKVKNDTKMEENEQFYIRLSDAFNSVIVDNLGVGTIVNDDAVLFNIERVNSDTVDNATQERKEALYTQIVGRDFNYAVVAYDENLTSNIEAPIEDVTIKVELIDRNSSAQLYEDYLYFTVGEAKSRLKRELPMDLNISYASENARYKISYLLDDNGSIIRGKYDNPVDYSDTKALYHERDNDSRDNFAIRPERFYMILSDGNMRRKENIDRDVIRLASGYDYDLNITATKYQEKSASLEYNTTLSALLEFRGNSSCRDDNNATPIEEFKDGENITQLFGHYNVGEYLLQLRDKEWTKVDWDKATPDCVVDSYDTSSDGNSMSGCSIASSEDINISFYPDHFAVDIDMQNLPNSTHPDFLYMSELNSLYNRVAIGFRGDITAQNENNATATNFTAGCVATDLLLNLKTTTISVEGINQVIHTINGTAVKFSRLIRYNSDDNMSHLDFNNGLQSMDTLVNIDSDKFLDENNGTVTLDMRYNINKHPTEPINPVEVTFHSVEVNSTEANSIAYDKVNIIPKEHTPEGKKLFLNNKKNFYFARVVSDLENYPRVNLTVSSIVRTPLNVDIFCNTNLLNYCQNRNVLTHTNLTSTTREQNGWFLSSHHNSELDGNVTALVDNPDIVTISPNPTPVGADDITLPNGENGMVMVKFNNCNSPQSTITIITDPELAFEPSKYVVSCKNSNTSWTGVGQTGNILNVKPTVKPSRKIDW